MFDIKVDVFTLKKYFIEYREIKGDWYIIPVPEFEYSKFITSYIGILGDDLSYRIIYNKISDFDIAVDNIIKKDFNEIMTFSFPDEETALYFKLKYCS